MLGNKKTNKFFIFCENFIGTTNFTHPFGACCNLRQVYIRIIFSDIYLLFDAFAEFCYRSGGGHGRKFRYIFIKIYFYNEKVAAQSSAGTFCIKIYFYLYFHIWAVRLGTGYTRLLKYISIIK